MSDPNLKYVTSEQLLAKAYFLSLVFEKVAVPLTGFTPSTLTVPLLLFLSALGCCGRREVRVLNFQKLWLPSGFTDSDIEAANPSNSCKPSVFRVGHVYDARIDDVCSYMSYIGVGECFGVVVVAT